MDLVGDILQQERGHILFTQDDERVEGRSGLSAWWIPLSDSVGIKVIHTVRYPKTEARRLGCTNIEEADRERMRIAALLEEAQSRLRSMARHLPDVYASLLVRHTGTAEWYGFREVRCDYRRHDEGAIYPALLMRRYPVLDQHLSKREEKALKAKVAACEFPLVRHFWGWPSNFGRLGDICVLLDIEDENGIKYT